MTTKENPFLMSDPEKVLQEHMKHARRMTREEFIQEAKQITPEEKSRVKK